MRTLAKPPQKTKHIQKTEPNQNIAKKHLSKKIAKTVFADPFHYKIETISHEDTDELKSGFLPYMKQLRSLMPIKQRPAHQKFISFKTQTQILQTLTHKDLLVGVKTVTRQIQKVQNKVQMVLVFYQQKYFFNNPFSRYDLLQKLFCLLIFKKIPFIITREIKQIKEQMAVKTLTVLGLKNQKMANKISKLCTKCYVQIPWLVNKQWIPLKDQ